MKHLRLALSVFALAIVTEGAWGQNAPPSGGPTPLFLDSFFIPDSKGDGPAGPLIFPNCEAGVSVRCAPPPPSIPVYRPMECEITYPNFLCPSVLPEGLHPQEWWYKHFQQQVLDSHSVLSCFLGCIGRHESIHAIDFSNDPSIRMCLTELHAFKDTISCFQECDRKFCFGYPILGARDCPLLYENLQMSRAAYVVNQCICNYQQEPENSADPICGKCLNSCREQGFAPAACQRAVDYYCRPMLEPIPTPGPTPTPTGTPNTGTTAPPKKW